MPPEDLHGRPGAAYRTRTVSGFLVERRLERLARPPAPARNPRSRAHDGPPARVLRLAEVPRLSRSSVLTLQGQAGNRAVARLLHPARRAPARPTKPRAMQPASPRVATTPSLVGVVVQRDETGDANNKWAEDSNAKIETVQDAVSKAKTNLNGDAQKAGRPHDPAQARASAQLGSLQSP